MRILNVQLKTDKYPIYIALLLVNRLNRNIFFVNVPIILLSPEAFLSPKCTNYRLEARLRPDPLGAAYSVPSDPLAGFERATSKGRGTEKKGRVWKGGEVRKEWG